MLLRREVDEIGLQGLDFILFDGDEEGVVIDGLSCYPYLIMLIKIWTRNWESHLERMNIKVNEDNGTFVVMVNGQSQKLW